MKKGFTLHILLIALIFIFSCSSTPGEGRLYITDQTVSESEIITVKILENTSNQLNKRNILKEYDVIVSYAGFNWYLYTIPAGSHEVYIEYLIKGNYGNKRTEVIIQGDSSEIDWAAIWLVNGYENSVRIEQGKGELHIRSSLLK